METISPLQLRHYFAATGEELVKLRCLVDPDEDGNFPTPDACRNLLAIRQGKRARDPITEEHKRSQAAQSAGPVARLAAKLRRAAHRRVPPV